MKGVAVLFVLAGISIFVLPLFRIYPAFLYALGNFRSMAAIILILIGVGIFLFSSYD